MKELFENWLKENLLLFENPIESVYIIDSKSYLLIDQKENKIIDNKFSLILSREEGNVLEEVDFVTFLWGDKFYYTPSSKVKSPEFNILRYVGQLKEDSPPFLGIHGKYELLNGSRDYSEWCKKAKFLNIKTLGICEKNTLAGTLAFQEECKKNKIKSILGETISIKVENNICLGKVFAINEKGWKNLLLINTEINVKNSSRYIDELKLLEFSEGLIFIFHPAYFPFDEKKIQLYSGMFLQCYFQLDSCEYNNEETDKLFIIETNKYLKSSINSVLISDAYYLESEDFEIKSILNTIGGERDLLSNNQWFKTYDENVKLLRDLFLEEDKFADIMLKATESLNKIDNICDFMIETGHFKLPQYKMSKIELIKYKTNEELFFDIIEKAFQEKIINKGLNFKIYFDRLERELDVIQKGDFIDYFLILWDIIKFCKENNILTGVGRGSAAGSLIAYLMDITKVDPIPYGLLFERFLNEGRIGKSLPDIDIDFESLRRNEVKQYMEKRYGYDKVCSIGTYTVFQIKSAFKDLSRLKGIDISLVNVLSKIFGDTYDESSTLREGWEYVFKTACKNGFMKKFVEENPSIINDMELILGQPKAASVHACATLILPENESIFTSIPIRQGEIGGEKLLVSEWEGMYIEKAGYLKEDILGINQLDKFRMIIELVKENYGEEIDIYSLPLDNKNVYEMFSKGKTGDVFHLGSGNLGRFCKDMQPTNIEDLIMALAIYRPGPIKNNFHNDLIAYKRKEKIPHYAPETQNILGKTFGLIIYQEQVMRICQDVGMLTLTEADDVRKAIGKKDLTLLKSFENKFMINAIKGGYSVSSVKDLWESLIKFGGYGFNKSHAAAYAITGYICQYLKWKYPLPYWITALEFADDDNIFKFLSEIAISNEIEVTAPHINKSDIKFKADFSTNKIVWSISKVKQCGPIAAQAIFEERTFNGQFFSLEEFIERVEKLKVNKSVIENLILAGAFDDLEEIKYPSQRRILISKYRKKNNIKVDLEKDWFELNKNNKSFYEDWFWSMLQKQVSGLAFFDYYSLIKDKTDWDLRKYISVFEINSFLNTNEKRRRVITAGFINEIEERKSKKGSWMKILIEQNYEFVWLYLWSELYDKFAETIKNNKDNILIFNGRIVFDDFKKENIIQAEDDFKIEILSKN